jgi:hypothetical protein
MPYKVRATSTQTQMSIPTTLEDKKKLWQKMKHGLHFYTPYLPLTLNNASTS